MTTSVHHLIRSIAIIVTFVAVTSSSAAVWYVSDDATPGGDGTSWPSAFDTIQAGIDAASDGDTVELADGTYTGKGNRDISFYGKAITVRSQNGPHACLINCQGTKADMHRGFLFDSGETSTSILEGITIFNGYHQTGGAIYANNTSPTILNCIFTDNQASGPGGAISCESSSSPYLKNCVLMKNKAETGGAIHCFNNSSPTLSHCTITSNRCFWKGSAINSCYNSPLELTNCIIWSNQEGDVAAISHDNNSEPGILYSDIQGGWQGEGNINADPRFAIDGADLHLAADSPCINSGSPSQITLDIENSFRAGAMPDMGAYEYDPTESSIIALSSTYARIIDPFGSDEPSIWQVHLKNRASGTLTWHATADADWLVLDPASGQSMGQPEPITFSADSTQLIAGNHTATITIYDSTSSALLSTIHVDYFKGTEHIVNAEGTADYPSIQAAIDASLPGDQVTCLPGVYSGTGNRDIDFQGKSITLKGLEGPSRTIINCTSFDEIDHSGIVFINNETSASIFDGFTITGVTGEASAVHCEQSNPTITNCIIRENNIKNHGGARPGQAPRKGVVYISQASPSVTDTIITKNQAIYGGGITSVSSATPSITNCVIVENTADEGGGGMSVFNSEPSVTNCIIRNQSTSEIYNSSSDLVFTWCNILGGEGASWFGSGCIDTDPLFAYPACFYLTPASPCIDAGTNTPAGGLPGYDLDGNPRPVDGNGDSILTADMGVYEYDPDYPVIAVEFPEVTFYSILGDASPAGKTISLKNAGSGTLDWSITTDASWLSASPAAGSSSGEDRTATINVDSTGLAAGHHTASLRISDALAINSPQWLTVHLLIGRTIRVPEDYPTIQQAIDAATVPGETVEIADGTWTGPENKNLDFKGKAITVRSASGNPHLCIIDCEQDGRGFYFHNGEGPQSIVDGLSIVHGFVDFENQEIVSGGGICCMETSPTIQNCIFRDSRVTCNEYPGWYASGGGIFCYSSSSRIQNCVFEGNNVGGNYNRGGAGFACDASDTILEGCVFRNNFTSNRGGAIYNYDSYLTVTDCFFKNNESGSGGAIFNYFTDLVIQNGWFEKNESQYSGGAIANDSWVTAAIKNCAFLENNSWYRGGAVDNDNNCSPIFTNCVFRNNTADEGGAMYDTDISFPVITNCIMWGGSLPQIVHPSSMPTVTYSNIQGGSGENWFQTGCIDTDPLFATDDSLYLLPQSPCIDTGTNTPYNSELPATDLDGNPRPQDGDNDGSATADMGVYEFMNAHSIIIPDMDHVVFHTHIDEGNPTSQTIELQNAGDIPSNWKIDGLPQWLKVSPTSGFIASDPVEVTLAVDISTLSGGLHSAELQIIDSQASNTPVVISVELYLAKTILIPADFPTIQDGIDAALIPHDIVEIADGIWTGEGNKNLTFRGKPITVRSESGNPESCIIDCEGDARGFFFVNDEKEDSILEGLTIRNGYVDSENELSRSGGGIYCYSADPTITNCIFENNETGSAGGGIYLAGSNSRISGCLFIDNSAASGAGVSLGYCIANISNCRFINNVASHNGGAINFQGAQRFEDMQVLTNCLFIHNVAGIEGGALYCWDMSRINMNVSNCTFYSNTTGENGGAIYNKRGTRLKLENCIVVDNSPDNIFNYDDSNTITATYSNIQGATGESWFGTGCIDTAPLFIDPDGPDNDPATWQDNSFRLAANSPCIDAGNNDAVPADIHDLDNNPRFIDDPRTPDTGAGTPPIVDMGPYEYQAPLFGDLNQDGQIDLNDFTLFAQCLAGPDVTTPPAGTDPDLFIRADLDHDDDVDLADFTIFQQQFEVAE